MRWEPFGRTDVDDPTTSVDDVFAGRTVAAPAQTGAREPTRRLVVVTCMDARIDPLKALNLKPGEAHVVRNAGAQVTEDVLRSVKVSRDLMGTQAVLVLGHTDCAAHGSTDDTIAALRAAVEQLPAPAAAALYDLQAGRLVPVVSRT